MDKELKCFMAEQTCEALMGMATGIVLTKTVMPKCNAAEKVVVALGTTVAGWAAARAFAKRFYKFCDDTFDTEFEEITEGL